VSNKLLAVVVLVATFVVGAVVGAAGDRLLMMRRPDHVPPYAAQLILRRLDRKLDLTDAQRVRIEEILKRRQKRINDLFVSVRPVVHAEVEAANDEIARVLTPEQRKTFEEMKLRMHGREHGRRGDRGRRGSTR
jgi:Spy/CpxP family protein refolding chaperone